MCWKIVTIFSPVISENRKPRFVIHHSFIICKWICFYKVIVWISSWELRFHCCTMKNRKIILLYHVIDNSDYENNVIQTKYEQVTIRGVQIQRHMAICYIGRIIWKTNSLCIGKTVYVLLKFLCYKLDRCCFLLSHLKAVYSLGFYFFQNPKFLKRPCNLFHCWAYWPSIDPEGRSVWLVYLFFSFYSPPK